MNVTNCGRYPPAEHRQPYCPVCEAFEKLPRDNADEAHSRDIDAIFDRCERVQTLHRKYARKSRHRR
jgi:hypothetical protein